MSTVLICQLEVEFATLGEALERAQWYSTRVAVEHLNAYVYPATGEWRLQITYRDAAATAKLAPRDIPA